MSVQKISFHLGTVIIKDKGSAKEGEKNKDKSQISVMSHSLIHTVLTFHTVLLMLKSGLMIANQVREFSKVG